MCGICGKLNYDHEKSIDQSLIFDMNAMLAHRGPNDSGYHFDGPLGFGHRRLSIIDLAAGHQPLSNEDGTVWIVFNGEIYNFRGLKADLEATGHVFRTNCDTEAIVHAYEEYGENCVVRLRGMFTFAIWDSRDRTLFCARDRFGIKPFYYRANDKSFSFASEVKGLLPDPECSETLNPEAIFDFFSSYVFGNRTMFQDVHRLPASHWLRVRDGKVSIQRYWWPEIQKDVTRRSAAENLDALEGLLREVVSDHMMSDVPQGTFLSGGVDSSLITLQMSKLINQPVHTFSISFAGNREFDESKYALQVAKACGAEHKVFDCTPQDIMLLPEVLWHLEEPLADAPTIALLILCREASKDVTVVHCGDGGDEGFGGYTRFYWDQYSRAYNRIPAAIRNHMLTPMYRGLQRLPNPLRNIGRRAEKFTRYSTLSEAKRYMTWFANVPESVKHSMVTEGYLNSLNGYDSSAVFDRLFRDAGDLGLGPLGTRQYHDLYSFCSNSLLLKGDKLTMASSIEGRYVWLDDRLVNFGLSLPDDQKMNLTQLKLAPRRLLAKHMPADFVWRKKQGFAVPIEDWFKGALKNSLNNAVSDSATRADGILNGPYLRQLVQELHAGNPHVWPYLWTAYVFQEWRKVFASPKQACRNHLANSPVSAEPTIQAPKAMGGISAKR
jgi:asparagine synthase (glutamine-hydrolysing)